MKLWKHDKVQGEADHIVQALCDSKMKVNTGDVTSFNACAAASRTKAYQALFLKFISVIQAMKNLSNEKRDPEYVTMSHSFRVSSPSTR